MALYTTNKSGGDAILPMSSTAATVTTMSNLDTELSSLTQQQDARSLQSSSSSIHSSSRGTLQTHLQELITSLCILIGGMYAPSYLRHVLLGGVYMRPIPHQVLTSGDVVLDLSLNQEWISDVTIPSSLLFRTCLYLPFLVMIVLTQVTSSLHHNTTKYQKLADAHAAICSLCYALGMSEGTVQMLKAYVGRLRPNFYSLCQFDPSILECTASYKHCLESRQSFPSGHSSFSFTGMGVLTLFLLGRYAATSNSSNVVGGTSSSAGTQGQRRGIVIASFIPLLYATFVASSRLVDNWHHPSDIIAGSLIGLFFAIVGYHLWYPPLTSPNAGIPLHTNTQRNHDLMEKSFL